MKVDVLKSKLHQACVTDANAAYEGSLGIDVELMEAVHLYRFEKILVANMANGARFETYAIPEPFGSRRIVLNGAAARLGAKGDRIIIMSFAPVEESELREGRYRPHIVRLDEHNEPVRVGAGASMDETIASMLEG